MRRLRCARHLAHRTKSSVASLRAPELCHSQVFGWHGQAAACPYEYQNRASGFKGVGLHYTGLATAIQLPVSANADSAGHFLKPCEGWARDRDKGQDSNPIRCISQINSYGAIAAFRAGSRLIASQIVPTFDAQAALSALVTN